MKCCRAGRLLAYKTMRKTNIFKPHRANPQQPLWDTSGKIHSILSNSLDGIRVLLWRSSWGGAIYRPLQTLSGGYSGSRGCGPKGKSAGGIQPRGSCGIRGREGFYPVAIKGAVAPLSDDAGTLCTDCCGQGLGPAGIVPYWVRPSAPPMEATVVVHQQAQRHLSSDAAGNSVVVNGILLRNVTNPLRVGFPS